MRSNFLRGFVGFSMIAAALGAAPNALACGGTFCDSPPPGRPPMPVDQSGENILFVLAQGHVEAHVQIQYTGDPTRFAWLVPVPKVPEVSVGSQQLFSNLLNGTVPTFSLQDSFEFCSGGRVSSPGCGFASSSDSSPASFAGVGQDAATTHSPPDLVTSHEAVGAFDVTVLSPKTAADVTAWLDANSFLQQPDAPKILQEYIDGGHVFVAVKLLPGAGVNEIHPLVIRYEGTAPCIPLKLTAVAATEDMGVRAFFLGERRVIPTTYREVTLNPARLDWLAFGSNYDSVVSSAVDEPGADGHAFVTEYAGSARLVSTTGVYSTSWNADAFRAADPERAMDLLVQQGLVTCSPVGCVAVESLLLPIVRKYLPAPPGVKESDFYQCVSCNAERIDRNAWDGEAFAKELDERVIAPGKHASELLARAPYLTRLFTRISPGEMTNDPEFAEFAGAADDVSRNFSATRNRTCGGDLSLEVPGRPALALDSGSIPRFTRSTPAALSVAEYDARGTRTVLFDNAADVDQQITSWNESQGYPHADDSNDSDGSGGGSGRGAVGCGCDLGSAVVTPSSVVGATFVLSLLRRLRRRSARSKSVRDGSKKSGSDGRSRFRQTRPDGGKSALRRK